MKTLLWWAMAFVVGKIGKLKVFGRKMRELKPLTDVHWNVKKTKHARPLMCPLVKKRTFSNVIILDMIR